MIDLYTLLTLLPSVVSLVGSHIYAQVLPHESAHPAITYGIVGGNTDASLGNVVSRRLRVEFHSVSPDYDMADACRSALIADLDGLSNMLLGTILLKQARLLSPSDSYDGETELHLASSEFYLYL